MWRARIDGRASRHQQPPCLGRAGGPGGSAPLPGPPLLRKGSPAEAGPRTSVSSQTPEEEMSGVRTSALYMILRAPRSAVRLGGAKKPRPAAAGQGAQFRIVHVG
jgi:hypothetical protein